MENFPEDGVFYNSIIIYYDFDVIQSKGCSRNYEISLWRSGRTLANICVWVFQVSWCYFFVRRLNGWRFSAEMFDCSGCDFE